MKAAELKSIAPAELQKKLRDHRAELLQLRLKKHSGQLEKPHLLKSLRQDIARMETFLRQKNQSPTQ